MIKYKCNENLFWINQENGSLNIENEYGSCEISFEETKELLSLLIGDRDQFTRKIEKANSPMTKIKKMIYND